MSFDIHYHTCNLGNRTVKQKNRFTGEVQSVPVDDGLTDKEKAAVRKLLRSGGASGPDDFGCCAVEFEDGGSAEVTASGLEDSEKCDGLMISLQKTTPALVNFLWELCRVGNMAATPIMADSAVVVTSEEQLQRVQRRWPDAIVVGSPDELGRFLKGGVAAWERYRDRVTADQGDNASEAKPESTKGKAQKKRPPGRGK